MMERVGEVIEKTGDSAIVRMRRHLACEKCGRCGGILGGPDVKDSQVEVENPIGAAVGQMVKIEVDDGKLLLISFVFYLVPLIALVGGILLGLQLAGAINFAGDHILFSVGSGLVFMVFVIGGIRLWDRARKDDPRYKPVITDLAEENEQV